jgi:hypothetical protein
LVPESNGRPFLNENPGKHLDNKTAWMIEIETLTERSLNKVQKTLENSTCIEDIL